MLFSATFPEYRNEADLIHFSLKALHLAVAVILLGTVRHYQQYLICKQMIHPKKSNINAGVMMAGASIAASKLFDNNAIEFIGTYTNLQPYLAVNKTNLDYFNTPKGGSLSTRFVSKIDEGQGLFKMNLSHSVNTSGTTIPNPSSAGLTVNFKLNNENTFFNSSFKYSANSQLKYFAAFAFSNNIDNIMIDTANVHQTDSRIQARNEIWSKLCNRFNLLSGLEVQHIVYTQTYDSVSNKFDELLSAVYLDRECKLKKWLAIKPGIRTEYSRIVARGNIVPRLVFAVRTRKSGQTTSRNIFFLSSQNKILQNEPPVFNKKIIFIQLHCTDKLFFSFFPPKKHRTNRS
ncbi:MULTISPECIES: hypothetical protein [unclassified Flavobacterium]|uniref:hypothetical protein n=1 Tax=unclassified Flavobacterium TaxID=196869 RepID=UPI00115FAA1B|nr:MULTISPECIES: hypothetical protein [unclassified Flavobacterium]